MFQTMPSRPVPALVMPMVSGCMGTPRCCRAYSIMPGRGSKPARRPKRVSCWNSVNRIDAVGRPLNPASSRFLAAGRAYQNLGRNAERIVQTANHFNRQVALSIQDLRDAGARPDQRFEVLAAQALLLHAKLDGLDRVRWV